MFEFPASPSASQYLGPPSSPAFDFLHSPTPCESGVLPNCSFTKRKCSQAALWVDHLKMIILRLIKWGVWQPFNKKYQTQIHYKHTYMSWRSSLNNLFISVWMRKQWCKSSKFLHADGVLVSVQHNGDDCDFSYTRFSNAGLFLLCTVFETVEAYS